MTGFTFQSLKPQDSLSNELRSVIRDNVLQFYAKGLSTETEEEGLTALYERLSQEDKLDGESNSITSSVHLTLHGQSKMPVTQVKKSKERHSR